MIFTKFTKLKRRKGAILYAPAAGKELHQLPPIYPKEPSLLPILWLVICILGGCFPLFQKMKK